MFGADGHGGARRAAEVDGNTTWLKRLHVGEGALDLVEVALVVEGGVAVPDAAHDIEELIGALVAGVLLGPVAIARKVGIATAGDDVEGHATTAEVIEADGCAGGHSGGQEPGAMRDQHVQILGVGGGMGGHQPAIGPGGVIADEDAVESGFLVRLRELLDEVAVDDALDRLRGGVINLGCIVGTDHADDLHEKSPFPFGPRSIYADRTRTRTFPHIV
jgi:hypothetical protein